MDDVMDRKKGVIIWRAVQSYIALSVFLILPTMGLRRNWALLVARLPAWREFDFFRAMDQVIAEGGRADKRDPVGTKEGGDE